MKIGIALGGGGARGFAHLGVLQALEEAGIRPDMVSGVSSGAIVGAFIAAGKKPAETMALMKDNKFLDYARMSLPVKGLFSLDNFEESIGSHLDAADFAGLRLPFYVAAANLCDGRIEYIHDGPLIPAIQASCSIPVLFSPVEMNGLLYVDGGLLDNLPYQPLIGQCDKIIAVNIFALEKPQKINNLMDVARRSFEMSIGIDRDRIRRDCDLLIEPAGLEDYPILDTSRVGEIYRIGYEYCKTNVDFRSFCAALGDESKLKEEKEWHRMS